MRSAAPRPGLLPRTLTRLVVVAVLGLAVFLPFAGRLLVRQDPLAKADLVFVLAGTRVERWLEAVDLYKEGWAPRIVLSPGLTDPVEAHLRDRGVSYPREGDLARDAAIALGVPASAVSVLPGTVDNTAAEAAALKRSLAGTDARRVIVVTSGYHCRRARFAFRREFAGSAIEPVLRASRYSGVQPTRWWRSRSDIRYVMNELPKLVVYLAGLGE